MEGSIPRLLRKIVPSRNVVEIQLRPVNDDEPETRRRISLIPLMITGLNARTMALPVLKNGVYTNDRSVAFLFFFYLSFYDLYVSVFSVFFFFFIKVGDFGGVRLNVDRKSTSGWKLELLICWKNFVGKDLEVNKAFIYFSILDSEIIH